ncbi:MAG: 30S ribosomal protein S8 [bacterium]|nr:30S ribosomal protein S8 [bacterium]
MSSDNVSAMLIQLKNATAVGKPFVELPYSRFREALAKILQAEGFVKEVKTFKVAGKSYKGLHLSEPNVALVIRYSKPGRRVYQTAAHLEKLRRGLGTVIISTSRGLLTMPEARKRRLGGEVICRVIAE